MPTKREIQIAQEKRLDNLIESFNVMTSVIDRLTEEIKFLKEVILEKQGSKSPKKNS